MFRSDLLNASTKDLTLTEQVDIPIRQAAIQVIAHVHQTGTPVILWENHLISERTSDEMESLWKDKPREVRPQDGNNSIERRTSFMTGSR